MSSFFYCPTCDRRIESDEFDDIGLFHEECGKMWETRYDTEQERVDVEFEYACRRLVDATYLNARGDTAYFRPNCYDALTQWRKAYDAKFGAPS